MLCFILFRGILTHVGVCFLSSLFAFVKLVAWLSTLCWFFMLLSVTMQSNTMALDLDPDWCKQNPILLPFVVTSR